MLTASFSLSRTPPLSSLSPARSISLAFPFVFCAGCVCVPVHVHAEGTRTFSSEVKSREVSGLAHAQLSKKPHISSSLQASIRLYFYSPGTAVALTCAPFCTEGPVVFKFGCGHGERQVHKSGISLQALNRSSSSLAYFLLKHITGFAARELEAISGVNLVLKALY